MADNIQVSQGKGTRVRTTEAEGVHTPHHIIDGVGSEDSFLTGKLTLVTSTPTALGASTAIKQIFVKAGSTNSEIVYVFPTTGVYTAGYELVPGESIPIIIDDVAKISVYSDGAGEEVYFISS